MTGSIMSLVSMLYTRGVHKAFIQIRGALACFFLVR